MTSPLEPLANPTGDPVSSTHSSEFLAKGDAPYPAVDRALTELSNSGGLRGEGKLRITLEAAIEELLTSTILAD